MQKKSRVCGAIQCRETSSVSCYYVYLFTFPVVLYMEVNMLFLFVCLFFLKNIDRI